jgi:uncharacterized protein YndB with AHSA1/START domain
MKLALLILASIVGVIILVVVLIALIGSFLPREHSATRAVLLHKSPETVYAVARDFERMPKWRDDVRSVNVKTGAEGRVQFREEGKHGAVNYELIEDVPGRRMVTKIMDTNLGYGGKWTYVFAAEGSNTRVTITEDGIVSNVIFRFLSRYAFGHTATIDTYLTALGTRFGETVAPQ